MHDWKRRLSAGLVGLLTFAAACAPAAPAPVATGGQAQPAEKKAANQVLRVAKVGLPGAVTPEVSSSNNEIFLQIFDTLLVFGPKYEIKPWVAEKWDFIPAENKWRFAIRRDLKFSNGDKLTADDVVYSINLMVTKKLAPATFYPLVTQAVKVDDYTVDVISKQPDASVPNGAPWMSILPAKYHQEVGTQAFGVKPIGSGPYELLEYKPADTIAFKLRAEGHAFRKPVFTEVRFRAIPELSQQVAGLRTGDLDIVVRGLTADQGEQLQKDGIILNAKPQGNVSALFSQPEAEARNTPLRIKKVREALNYAVNKEAIAKSLYKGLAVPAGQLGLPDTLWWDPSVQAYPYDPAKAKALLAEAGYPNGFKLPVGIGYTPQTANPNVVLALQSDLKAVGVEAEVNSYEFATFLDQYYGRNGQQKGDLFVQNLGDQNGFFSQGRGLYDCAKTGFEIWWCNREFNRLWDLASAEPDAAKRQTLFRQANAAMREDIPQILIVALSDIQVHNPKIKGWVWNGTAIYHFDDGYRVE